MVRHTVGESIQRGIFHVVYGFPLHFMLYREYLDCFSNSVPNTVVVVTLGEVLFIIYKFTLTYTVYVHYTYSNEESSNEL